MISLPDMTSPRDLVRDLRHAARTLVRTPGHALVVVATLAVGVGAVVREALLRPLPFREPDRLVRVWDRGPNGMDAPMSPPVWQALRARTDVFETVGGSTDSMYTLTGQGEPESLVGYRFSADFFPMLGPTPLLGRVFVAGEDRPGADRVVVLSHPLWRRKFGSDPGVVGRSIMLSGHSGGCAARRRPIRVEGEAPAEAGSESEVEVQWIGVGYRDAMRIPLLVGRDFEERDRESARPGSSS